MSGYRRLLITATFAIALLLIAASMALAAGGRPFVVGLSGGTGGDPDGTGTALLRVNPGNQAICYTITVSNIGQPTEPGAGLGAAHIHDYATTGIFVDLETNWTATTSGFMTTGCTDADRGALIALLRDPSGYYVNIHTVDYPGGAIRGDLR